MILNIDSWSDNSFDNLIIFPNPSSKYISLKSFDNIYEIYIYDMNGKLVLLKSNFDNNLNITILKEGSYFLLAKTNHSLIRKKFIVKN